MNNKIEFNQETKVTEPLTKGTDSVVNIINELKQTSSRNVKESILKREFEVNNEELEYIFFMTYSPSINFYIKKIPQYTNIREVYDCVTSVKAIEEVVCSRKKTGQEAIDYVSMILSNTVKEDAPIVEAVIKRDLDCGVQEPSINKVWKGLIKKPPYMSYSLFNEKLVTNFKLPCFSEVKQDGVYSDVIVTSDSITYMSRSGKEFKFTLPSAVEDKFKSLCNEMSIYSAPYVMHGEFLVLKDDGTFEERTVGNGYLNSDNVDPNKVCFVCWDNILLEQYNEGYSSIPYYIRNKFTSRIVEIINSPHVQKVEQVVCNTTEELINHFVECRSKGLEGTVVKQFEMPWKDHKTKLGLKLKNQFDCEYIVTGVQEHSKKKNQVGALFVESSCGKVKFKVGSGLTDKQRKDFWLTQDKLIGKIVTVRGNDLVSSESKDTYSINLGRLIEVRVDKSEADDYDKIVESKDSILDLLKQIK